MWEEVYNKREIYEASSDQFYNQCALTIYNKGNMKKAFEVSTRREMKCTSILYFRSNEM